MTSEQSALENVLADIFREVSTAGRIADMAGLDVAQIDRTGSSADVWHSIITMAIQDGVLNALIERAVTERPRNKELPEAYAAYKTALPSPRVRVQRPPRGQDGERLSDYRADERRDARIDQMQRDMADMRVQMAGLVVQVAELKDMMRKQAEHDTPSISHEQFAGMMILFAVVAVLMFAAVYYGGSR